MTPISEPPLIPLYSGFLLWAALSALGFAASWMLAARLLPGRGTLARLQLALLSQAALTLSAVQALGALTLLYRWPLALVGALLFSTVLWRSRSPGWRELLAHELRAPLVALGELWSTREPLALALLACAIPYGAQALIVWCFRSWTWDPTWYHTAITNSAITEHGLGFLVSHNVRAAGFARNLELLSVWNVLLPRDLMLDDIVQFPFAALAFVTMALWARQLGAARGFAAVLGALFLLAPPMFMEVGSTHVDIACGALLLMTWQQWTGAGFGRRERVLGLVALFFFIGTKFTGLFHAGLLAPLFLVRGALVVRRERGALFAMVLELVVLAPVALWLGGGLVYWHNWQLYKNPMWPIELRVLGRVLPGAIDSRQEWTPPFFVQPGTFARMLHSWYTLPNDLWPDVRGGGFGPIFRWLGLWCTLLLPLLALRRAWRGRALAVLGLFVLALTVPDAWWPRFTLCAGAAAIGALLLVHQQLRFAWPQRAFSAVVLALACAGIPEGWPALYPLRHLREALFKPHLERAMVQPIPWLWSDEACRLRERDLHEGEAIAFDDAIFFLADLWTNDLRNRVVFVQHPADGEQRTALPGPGVDADYLARLQSEHAVWASVRRGGSAERALAAAGARFLFITPTYPAAVYRLPWARAP